MIFLVMNTHESFSEERTNTYKSKEQLNPCKIVKITKKEGFLASYSLPEGTLTVFLIS